MKKRSGEQGEGYSGTYTNTDTRPNPDTVTSGPSELAYDYARFEGWDLDNYYARKKRGELLPFTPWKQYKGSGSASGTYDWVETATGLGVKVQGYNRLPSTHLWTDVSHWNISESEIEQMIAPYSTHEYVQAAAAKVYSKGWDALTFAAELNKTAALFVRTVTRLRQYILSGQIEKIWLEGRYGWRLIMYDIKDINKMLNSLDDQRKRFKDRVGTTISLTENDSHDVNWSSSSHTLWTSTEWKIGLRGAVVADIDPPDVTINPITTSWELIPWSFVIDWVINVGTTLNALSFLVVNTGYTAAGGVYATGTRTCGVSSVSPKSGFTINDCSFDSDFTAEYTLRTPQSVSLIPQINLNLDALKVMDLVALFVQAVRR